MVTNIVFFASNKLELRFLNSLGRTLGFYKKENICRGGVWRAKPTVLSPAATPQASFAAATSLTTKHSKMQCHTSDWKIRRLSPPPKMSSPKRAK